MKFAELSQFLMDTIEDIVYVSDLATYEMYYLNGAGKAMFHFTEDSQWHGKKCYEVLQGKDAPCDFCTNHLLRRDSFCNWEYYNPKVKNHYHIQNRLITFGGVDARFEIAKNITKQKELEESLAARLAQQQLITDSVAILQSGKSPSQSVDEMLALVGEYYQAERGYVFDLVECDKYFSNTYEWCAPGVEPQIENLQRMAVEIGNRWFQKFRTEGGFYIDSITQDVAEDTEEYKILTEQGISSVVTCPLWSKNGELLGFMGVDNPTCHQHNVETMTMMTAFVVDYFEKNILIENLNQLSYYDNLTNLRNRNSYSIEISHLRHSAPCSLGTLYVDINALKMVNDVFGHRVGDSYILSVTRELHDIFGGEAYRIGGDELVVLARGMSQQAFDKKVKALRDRMVVGQRSKVSMGATWTADSREVHQQIDVADKAMYEEKKRYKETRSMERDIVFAREYLEKNNPTLLS